MKGGKVSSKVTHITVLVSVDLSLSERTNGPALNPLDSVLLRRPAFRRDHRWSIGQAMGRPGGVVAIRNRHQRRCFVCLSVFCVYGAISCRFLEKRRFM